METNILEELLKMTYNYQKDRRLTLDEVLMFVDKWLSKKIETENLMYTLGYNDAIKDLRDRIRLDNKEEINMEEDLVTYSPCAVDPYILSIDEINLKKSFFNDDIKNIINLNSLENISDTPDFILSEYIVGCLTLLDETINRREQWYGRKQS